MSEALNFTAIFISVFAFILSLTAIILVMAQRLSTHKIEWKPLEIHDPMKPFKDDETTDQSDEDFLNEAYRLAEEGRQKKKKKEEDPMEFLESSNF